MKDSIRLTAFGLRKVAFMGNIFYLNANTCYKWIFIFILQFPALHPLYPMEKAPRTYHRLYKEFRIAAKRIGKKRIKTVAMDTALKMSFIYNVLIR